MNRPIGLFLGKAFIGGFAVVWHIYWLAPLALLGIILCVIIRTTSGEHEYKLTAAKISKLEAARVAGKAAA